MFDVQALSQEVQTFSNRMILAVPVFSSFLRAELWELAAPVCMLPGQNCRANVFIIVGKTIYTMVS